MNIEPIPREILDRAVRRCCRNVASVLISAMAETDTSIEKIAERLGKNPKVVASWIKQLIDGNDPGDGIRWISEIATAMDCRLHFSLERLEPAAEPPTETSDAATTVSTTGDK